MLFYECPIQKSVGAPEWLSRLRHLNLDFSLGHDLMVCGMEQALVWLSLHSQSMLGNLFLPLSPSLKINKLKYIHHIYTWDIYDIYICIHMIYISLPLSIFPFLLNTYLLNAYYVSGISPDTGETIGNKTNVLWSGSYIVMRVAELDT